MHRVHGTPFPRHGEPLTRRKRFVGIAATRAAPRGGTLTLLKQEPEFDSLDPATLISTSPAQLIGLTNDGLVTFNRVGGSAGLQVVPDLAAGLLGLRWRAVLWDQNAILVRRAFTEVGGDRLPKGRRVHSVPAARQVLDLLARVQALQRDPQPDDRVFQGPAGTPMDGSALYRRYREIQKAAGVRALRIHDLRHTFGTQAIASGAHVNDVREWMGHRHLSATMRYVHHRPRHEAAAALERHFTGAAAELDRLLGAPAYLQITPPEWTPGDDSGRPENAA